MRIDINESQRRVEERGFVQTPIHLSGPIPLSRRISKLNRARRFSLHGITSIIRKNGAPVHDTRPAGDHGHTSLPRSGNDGLLSQRLSEGYRCRLCTVRRRYFTILIHIVNVATTAAPFPSPRRSGSPKALAKAPRLRATTTCFRRATTRCKFKWAGK